MSSERLQLAQSYRDSEIDTELDLGKVSLLTVPNGAQGGI